MTSVPTIYTGTIGQSIWRSPDGGESWQRATQGMFIEANIRALAISPENSAVLFAGTEEGLYRTEDGGDSWQLVDSPMNDLQIWALAIDPTSPDTMYAGTCPSALFRTHDGGESWQQLNVELADECVGVPITPRVTSILIDPEDSQTVYAGIEIDGMRISRGRRRQLARGQRGPLKPGHPRAYHRARLAQNAGRQHQ